MLPPAMRFAVDESTGHAVAEYLRATGHDAYSVYETDRGLDDESILANAVAENRILITNDDDFGEMIFARGLKHAGVIFLRLRLHRTRHKIEAIRRVIQDHADELPGRFATVTDVNVRFPPPP